MSTALKEGKQQDVKFKNTLQDQGEMFSFLTTCKIGVRGLKVMFVPKAGCHQEVAKLLLKLRKNTFIYVSDTGQSQAISIAALSGKYTINTQGFVVELMKAVSQSCLAQSHLECLESISY